MADGIVLFSAGLDSSLAARLLIVQSLNVRLVTFLNPFVPDSAAFREGVRSQAAQVGWEAEMVEMGPDYLQLIANPTKGYGKNLNPCIDCRIYQLRRAKTLLEEDGGGFIATGEVIGQRPMSQGKNTMEMIDREAGVTGLVVRPLCAKLLEPSRAEEEGVIDREKLLDIKGRSRRRQMALAKELGIESYPTPAGGCLLTDRDFSVRLRDLMGHEGLSHDGIELLKVGRQFRVADGARAAVGRDEKENARLRELLRDDDLLIEPVDFKGPDCLVRGEDSPEARATGCALIVRYSKAERGTCRVSCGGRELELIETGGLDEEACTAMRIGGK
jgi:tRNA U34 2-thiouridine synthase MnmA/TrmU